MNDQNKNHIQALSLAVDQQVWQNLKLALVFTSALINLYVVIAIIVVASLS